MICFAAHPDDETIGAGGQLAHWSNVHILHATDGAPRNMEDARRYGFDTREAYAHVRREELSAALRIAGVGRHQTCSFNFVDQECCRNLTLLVVKVCRVLLDMQPGTALVPPYEGGHPDHDSLAFAVHTACRLLAARGQRVPILVEHAMYHGASGEFRAGVFLPATAPSP